MRYISGEDIKSKMKKKIKKIRIMGNIKHLIGKGKRFW